jgi:hypothetical protein
MNIQHIVSEEVINESLFQLLGSNSWVAYDSEVTSLRKHDVHFFRSKGEAKLFAESSDGAYKIIYANSVMDLARQLSYGESIGTQLKNLKANFMNEKNYEHLKDNLKYLGFGEKLHEDLQKNLSEGKESFQLKFTTEINKKPFEAILNFRKSNTTDNYFLNSYQASLERSNGQRMGQQFYLDDGHGVTAKEAYNLLEGRAVHKELENKEGQKYQAWIQLDFSVKDKRDNYEVKQYYQNYGFDLKEAVSKFAVAELLDPEKEKSMLRSLEKGNMQAVTIEKEGMSHKMFVEANPQYKSVNLYDANFKRVQKESMHLYTATEKSNVVKEDKAQEIKQDTNKSAKQGVKEGGEQQQKKTSRKNGMGV